MWNSEASDAEDCGGVLRELVEAIREDYEQRAYFVTGTRSLLSVKHSRPSKTPSLLPLSRPLSFLCAVRGAAAETAEIRDISVRFYDDACLFADPRAVTPHTFLPFSRPCSRSPLPRPPSPPGDISGRFYDASCLFADPTIQFSGLQRWQRNIALLTRFFSAPTIHLQDLQVFPATPSSAARLETRWRLLAPINLPWRPVVDIHGSTVHTLSAAGTKVVSHVEAWEVSAYEAIMQLFRPGPPAPPSPPG
ncbi:unnamed protein product [Closterium sp. Naga37s-1]|nr:unnamed protein product [Closterium sp. Naga37s-1]